VYDPGWLPTRIAAYVLGKPLWWALEQLGVVGEEGDGHGEKARTEWWDEYVVLALVERLADAIVAAQARRATGPAAGLYTFEGFRKAFGDVVGQSGMSEMNAKVLVRFLERDRRVVVFDSEVRVLMSGCVFVLADRECREVSSSSLGRMPRQSPVASMLSTGGFWS
jgi:charged multivesicular body protein 7